MPQFLLKRGTLVREGKKYKPGDKVELPQNVADRMQVGMLEPVATKAKEPAPPAPERYVPEEKQEPQEPGESQQQGKGKGKR